MGQSSADQSIEGYSAIAAIIYSDDDTTDISNVNERHNNLVFTLAEPLGKSDRLEDVEDASRETLLRCAIEPPNDTGNGQRLLHHFGADLLNVRNVGWHAWTGAHWEREGGNDIATRHAQATAARIALEADFMVATSEEQRLIDAAQEARAALARMEETDGPGT